MRSMITDNEYKVLKILSGRKWDFPICPRDLALELWSNDPSKEYLFNANTNTGNGACSGKKAWLCAGSLAGKLIKKGLAERVYIGWSVRYRITAKGLRKIEEYELEHKK